MPKQLTTAVRPSHYKLHFGIDFDSFTFSGSVVTHLTITEPQRILRQHCENLTITTCELNGPDGISPPVSYSLTKDEMHITGEAPFAPGEYRVRIDFSGVLSDNLSGLYRSSYTDTSGNSAYLATTQFEAPYARQAFPCFDEPQFKAMFTLSMDIPAEMTGISNMPITGETVNGNRKTVLFDTTPPMSTYLLYLGAGVFDYIEEKRGQRIIRVYGVNGKSEQGAYALTFAADSLEFFEEYTGVPYPLPKLDLIAIPDFAAGAMENWGAVTFREVLLFVDEKETSLAAKKRVAEVIAHELWHQWSGNLVTMRWWDDLWLNEAFATYNAYRAVDHFHPDWHIWEDFLGSETGRAFDMDMLSSTHPIAVTVKTPNEIEEVFDAISYGKGGSVLCMIEHYIGEEPFRKGVGAYLEKFAFKNAVAKDLWDTLEAYSGKPVRDILVAWITTAGFPLLKARQEGTTVTLRQQRFSAKTDDDSALWPIPLTWAEGDSVATALMKTPEQVITSNSSPVKFNLGQTGFYRILYSAEMNAGFRDAIVRKQLPVHDRYGILDDLWSGVLAGHGDLSALLDFMVAYRNEGRLFVLDEINTICGRIALYLNLPDNGEKLFSRFKAPFSTELEKLGWAPASADTPEERQLRALAISFLISAGATEVVKEARLRADAYLEGDSLDPDLRNACLRSIATTAESDSFEQVRNAFESRNGAEEKIALLSTMAGFNDSRLLETSLDYALSDAVRRQDLRTVFARVGHNPISSGIFFEWVRANWGKLSHLKASYFVFMGLLQTVIISAPDAATLDSVRKFLEEHTDGFENTKANAFEKAHIYLQFRDREREPLK